MLAAAAPAVATLRLAGTDGNGGADMWRAWSHRYEQAYNNGRTGVPPTGAVKGWCIPSDSRMALTRVTCAWNAGAKARRISFSVSGSSLEFLAAEASSST